VILHSNRDRLRKDLESRGIATGLHYPIPLHLQKAYAHLGYSEGDFPVAERIGRECLSLPLFPEMTIRQQDAVIEAVVDCIREESWN
jgi:dTDP-4-amino-4,6-dideoxygalactose transaminase